MSIEERLERIERLLVIGSKEALNTSEVALMLDMAVQTVRNLMHDKAIPYYKRGGKAYFRKSEIEAWMLKGQRIVSNEEIAAEASTYIAIKRMNTKQAQQ
jgi:hypothetical protein